MAQFADDSSTTDSEDEDDEEEEEEEKRVAGAGEPVNAALEAEMEAHREAALQQEEDIPIGEVRETTKPITSLFFSCSLYFLLCHL